METEQHHYGVYVHCEKDAWRVIGVFDNPEEAGKQVSNILRSGNFTRVEAADITAMPKNVEPF